MAAHRPSLVAGGLLALALAGALIVVDGPPGSLLQRLPRSQWQQLPRGTPAPDFQLAGVAGIRNLVGGFIASEDGVKRQAILPAAWVAAVVMAGAFVLSMPEKAHAGYCWSIQCYNTSPSPCPSACGDNCYTWSSGCQQYGSSGTYRCRCGSL